MNSIVKKLEKSVVEIEVEVSAEEMKPFLVKAANRISEKAKIDGFRPGKASYEVIEQKFGAMAIMEEALDSIISKTYFEAVTKDDLMTIGQPEIKVEKMAPGNPLVYKAKATILPKVKLGDYSKIEIKKEKVNVKPEQADRLIDDLRKMRATHAPVERAAASGDRLEIDFEVLMDNVLIDNGSHKKYPITIGEGRFIPGFEEQLVGLKVGDEKSFDLKFPENYYEKNLGGKLATFKVKCLAVMEEKLPELNDEFAGAISGGKFKDVAELKKNVLENIEEEEQHKLDNKIENDLLDKMIEISEFEEIPEMLIDGEAHKMVHELADNVERQGMKFDDYLTSIKKTHDDLEKDFFPQAEKRVKASLITREVYQAEKIEVTPEELAQEIEVLAGTYKNDPEIKARLASEEYQDYLSNMIGNRKVMEHLKKSIIK